MSSRIVALVDMDCFYCQVEQKLNPALKGKPVAVVQYKKWRGGGIIAVNYEARKFGVNRNMRGDEAKSKCPDINLVRVPENRDKADISKYREAGRDVIDVLCQFSNCVERASIDEAYLDITQAVEQRMQENPNLPSLNKLPFSYVVGYEPNVPSGEEEEDRVSGVASWLADTADDDEQRIRLAIAAELVEEMRAAVLAQTGFTCSAGIAHNKTLSKLVCGLHKPARQTVLPFVKVPNLYATIPVHKVRSLGGKFGESLTQLLGVTYMADLERFSEPELCQKFDQKTGPWLYNLARGIDNDPVNARLVPKSIGCCKRFPGKTALSSQQDVEHWISELAKEVSERLNKDLEENRRRARALIVQWSLKIGGSSSSKTGTLGSYDASSIAAEAMHLLSKANSAPLGSSLWKPPLQFLGINVSKFTEEENKNSSIQRFFKPVAKATSSHSAVYEPEEANNQKSMDAETSHSKSFFLNYSKKPEVVTLVTEEGSSDDDKVDDDANFSRQEEEENGVEEVQRVEPTSSKRFFKPADKATSSHSTLHETEKSTNQKSNSKTSNSKSFFLNYSKKPEVATLVTEEGSSDVDEDAKFSRQEDENCVEEVKSAETTSSQELSTSYGMDQMAPCPQCEVLTKICEMSEHLDHHIAQELHEQLNSAPSVSQPAPSVNSQTNNKRKYTKSMVKNSNTTNAKTKRIDSFFGPSK